MFISFLYSFPVRGVKAPYLWTFYRQMTMMKPEDVVFLGSADYFKDPESYLNEGRWEVQQDSAKSNGYTVPSEEQVARYRAVEFDTHVFDALIRECEGDYNKAWKSLLREPYEPLVAALRQHVISLQKQYADLRAILCWCNCPSLDLVARECGLKVIYNEIGPFRKPVYSSTAYFDFSGVNGHTECHARYLRYAASALAAEDPLNYLEDKLWRQIARYPYADGARAARGDLVGVALQVEDDSNVIAYSNGYDNFKIIDRAVQENGKDVIAIRKHPLGHLDYAALGLAMDASRSSLEFILKCRKVYCINSSVGFEAMLLGRDACIAGDNPVSFITTLPSGQRNRALAFALFGYLIPYELLYDPAYYNWRLSNPPENEIICRHLQCYLNWGANCRDEDRDRSRQLDEIWAMLHKVRTEFERLKESESHLQTEKVALKEMFDRQADKSVKEIARLGAEGAQKDAEIARLGTEGLAKDAAISHLNDLIGAITSSRAWRITAPLRRIATEFHKIRQKGAMKTIRGALKQIVPFGIMKVWIERKYGTRIDMPLFYYAGFLKRAKRIVKFCQPYCIVKRFAIPFVDKFVVPEVAQASSMIWDTDSVTILCTRHVVYIARLMERVLRHFGKIVKITTEEPERYGSGAYIVICPQMFRHLPLNFAAFQLEQTVSSRWLTPEYIKRLNDAMPVFEYSLKNVSYWLKEKMPLWRLYYLPVDFLPGMREKAVPQVYDVAFYGDPHALRRQACLAALRKRFNVHVISEVFGKDLYRELSKAKVVVNIHYYDNAMLETTRIYETLSLGRSIIVSERSSDPEEEKRLEGLVDFVPVGDNEALCARIAHWLESDARRNDKIESNYTELSSRGNAFDYFFARYLLAFNVINFKSFYQFAGNYVKFSGDRVCLSLPESTERRAAFDRDNRYGFEVFPALRHLRGWTGCGMSYKFIIMKAQEQGLKQITVCEDDVGFPSDFDQRMEKCRTYLKQHKGWHVFQGMMANVGNVTIKAVDHQLDECFVTLDHMISMVYNIYDAKAYPYLIKWNERNADPENNTIDKALEGHNLHIVTTHPFLVEHKEELPSDLWGLNNADLYGKLLKASRDKLGKLVSEFESK